MTIKDRIPFLKVLTSLDNVLDEVDDELETNNFLESLDHFERYLIFNDFLTTLIEHFDIEEDEIEIGEGFLFDEICKEYGIEPTNSGVYKFNSILFRVPNHAISTEVIENIISEMLYYKKNIESIEIDVNSGWVQVIIGKESTSDPKITIGS